MLDRMRFAAVLLSLAALPVTGCVASERTPAGKWSLVAEASDEFDGLTLDAAKWKTGLWYDTSGVRAFRPDNVTVSGGNLVLTARKEAFNGKTYTGGAVESLFDVPGVNSYVEVRAKALPRRAIKLPPDGGPSGERTEGCC